MTKGKAADNANLALWNQVEKTDPEQTKKITGKAYSGTSPKPYYLIHKATETFGPCGIGWGFTIVSERVEQGAGGESIHIAHVRVWYVWGEKRGEVEHIGGTPFSGTRKSGQTFADEDAPKKSVTDALVKALSLIGFAGDIFAGLYDDDKYVRDLRNEASGHDPTPDLGAQREAYLAMANKLIPIATDATELRDWWLGEKERRQINGLTQADVNALKEAVMNRLDAIEKETKKVAA